MPKEYIFIQAPLENTTSFVHGTSLGPQAFHNAWEHLEKHEAKARLADFSKIKFRHFDALNFQGQKNEAALAAVTQIVSRALSEKSFPILLGGEQTLCVGVAKAHLNQGTKKISVLHFGAQLHARDTHEGSTLSHLCALRRAQEAGANIFCVGTRAGDVEEFSFTKSWSAELPTMGVIEKKLGGAKQPVHISINPNIFSPSEAPSSSYPEPGGQSFEQVSQYLEKIVKKLNVQSLGIYDLRPIPQNPQTELLLARLVQRIVGWHWHRYWKSV